MKQPAPEDADSAENEEDDAHSDRVEKKETAWQQSSLAYVLVVIALLVGFLSLWVGVEHAIGRDFQPHDTPKVQLLRTVVAFVLAATCLGLGGGIFYSSWTDRRKRRREVLAELRSSLLSGRAAQASIALQEATQLYEELRVELEARTALLEDVKRQVADTSRRAQEIEKLTRVDEETTQILNRYFDEALSRRLRDFERDSRRREWLLGTLGALACGVIAILAAHYLFGY
jgi:hypothetical protein